MNDKDLRHITNINILCKEIQQFVYKYEIGEFNQDLKTNKACILNLEQIGEQAKKLSPEFKQTHNNMPWQAMADFRNIVAHNYFGVDLDEVWDILIKDIPELLEFTEMIIQMGDLR